jgi:hypothetical protein
VIALYVYPIVGAGDSYSAGTAIRIPENLNFRTHRCKNLENLSFIYQQQNKICYCCINSEGPMATKFNVTDLQDQLR